jgi:hypothetical protein
LFALALGLLLVTSYTGLILLVLIAAFSAGTRRGRVAFRHMEPWIAILLVLFVVFPHVAWLRYSHDIVQARLMEPGAPDSTLPAGFWLFLTILLAHLGVVILALLASGWRLNRREQAPVIERNPPEPFGRAFIYFFAVAPSLVAIAIASATGRVGPLDRIGPLLVFSGLAVILAAGDQVQLFRERMVSFAWAGLLVLPPVLTVVSMVALPWMFGTDLKVSQPAGDMGRFFADSYQRRTNRPLPYVAGDTRMATLIALAAPSRPSVYFEERPERSPWVTPLQIRERGGILLWPTPETSRQAPQALRDQFPEMVPEVPRAFARIVQGVVPLTRVGWAVIRPQGAPGQ